MANIQNFETRSNLPVNTPRLNFVATLAFLAPVAAGALATLLTFNPAGLIVGVLLGLLLAQSPKIARQWERAVVLRLGKFTGLRGPGLFWIVPFVDNISTWIDQRVITTAFAAEETLTSDTVPVTTTSGRASGRNCTRSPGFSVAAVASPTSVFAISVDGSAMVSILVLGLAKSP